LKELWDKHKANIGLAVLIIYCLSLGVATADEVFHLGIFKTKIEKMVAACIDDFSAERTRQDKAVKDLVEYGEFAVPQLVRALDRGGPAQELSIQCLQQITGQTFKEPAQWKDWYRQHESEFR
jgi:hypothetical protein